MTGYLIWGYFILYIVGVLVGIGITVIRIFAGDSFFGSLALKLVPVVVVVVIKTLINKLVAKYAFTNRKFKILTLDNYRIFNLFLYFNFYFDCFMGIISAVIRLIKSIVVSIFMMPSKVNI